MNSLMEGSLAMGVLFTVALLSNWTMKTVAPKQAVKLATVELPRHKKGT